MGAMPGMPRYEAPIKAVPEKTTVLLITKGRAGVLLKIFNGGHYRRSEDGRLKGSRGTLSAHRARERCR
jgi:hypothetical protein